MDTTSPFGSVRRDGCICARIPGLGCYDGDLCGGVMLLMLGQAIYSLLVRLRLPLPLQRRVDWKEENCSRNPG